MKTIIVFTLLFICGCSTQKDIIRERDIEITLPVEPIQEKIKVEPVNLDTSYNAFVESFTDTSSLIIKDESGVVDVKIKRKFNDKGKPELRAETNITPPPVSGTYKDIDTTHQVIQKKSFFDELQNIIVLIIVGAVVIGLIVFFVKRK